MYDFYIDYNQRKIIDACLTLQKLIVFSQLGVAFCHDYYFKKLETTIGKCRLGCQMNNERLLFCKSKKES